MQSAVSHKLIRESYSKPQEPQDIEIGYVGKERRPHDTAE